MVADTTNNLLKLRNSANNAWITLRELDGTLLMEHGTASAPGLAFDGDLNTGIYRPEADAVGLTTGGAERFAVGGTEVVVNDPSNDIDFRVESNGVTHMLFVDGGTNRVGIGASAPGVTLDISAITAATRITSSTGTNPAYVNFNNTAGNAYVGLESSSGGGAASGNAAYALHLSHQGAYPINFSTNNALRATIDSSGRLLVGASSGSYDLEVKKSGNVNLLVGSTNASAVALILDGDSNGDGSGGDYADITHTTAGDLQYRNLKSGVHIFQGTSSTERCRIDSSGRLLLGTSTGQSASGHTPNLQVSGTDFSSATVSITNNANSANGSYLFFCKQRSGSPGGSTVLQNNDLIGQLRFVGGDGSDMDSLAATIDVKVDSTPGSNDMPGRMVFSTTADGASSPTERMRITSGGVVAVNRTAALHGGVFVLDYTNGTSAGLAIKDTQTSGTGVVLHVVNGSGTVVGGISQNQSTTSFNTSSDYRLKENVIDVTDGITRVKQLQPRRFNFIADDSRTVDGFLAHEAQTVVPEAVTGTHNEVDDDGNPVYQGIDQSKLVPLLTAALQEAIAKIETLETKVAALEAG